jgi:hypothetical protein
VFFDSLQALLTGGNLSGDVCVNVLQRFVGRVRKHHGFRIHKPEGVGVRFTWRGPAGDNIRAAINCSSPEDAQRLYSNFIEYLRTTNRKEPTMAHAKDALATILAEPVEQPLVGRVAQGADAGETRTIPHASEFVANDAAVALFLELIAPTIAPDGKLDTKASVQVLRERFGLVSTGKNTRAYNALVQLVKKGVLEHVEGGGYRLSEKYSGGQVVIAEEPTQSAPTLGHSALIGDVTALRERVDQLHVDQGEYARLTTEMEEINQQLANLTARKDGIAAQMTELLVRLEDPRNQSDLAAYAELLHILVLDRE